LTGDVDSSGTDPRGAGFPVAQACPDRAAPAGSSWSATPAERPGPGRRGLVASGAPSARQRRGFPERRGPGRVALAAGGRFRVVGPEALPAGGTVLAGRRGTRSSYRSRFRADRQAGIGAGRPRVATGVRRFLLANTRARRHGTTASAPV
jgi:hypothetical protein